MITDMGPRLAAAAAAVADARSAWTDAVRLRDELVVAAVDQGMSHRPVARAAKIAPSRVCAILAGSQDEED